MKHKNVHWCMIVQPLAAHPTLTILVLTSFSMALTSSAALGTSEDDCRDVSKDEDWEEEEERTEGVKKSQTVASRDQKQAVYEQMISLQPGSPRTAISTEHSCSEVKSKIRWWTKLSFIVLLVKIEYEAII